MNSIFMPEPSMLLVTKEETLHAINNPVWMTEPDSFPYRVKSKWLCDLANILEQRNGFLYNFKLREEVEQQLGIYQPEVGSPLNRLVYNAQNYRTSDNLRQQGYEPLTKELLAKIFGTKAKLVLQNGTKLSIRKVNGELYAFLPRKRVYAVNFGNAVRVE